ICRHLFLYEVIGRQEKERQFDKMQKMQQMQLKGEEEDDEFGFEYKYDEEDEDEAEGNNKDGEQDDDQRMVQIFPFFSMIKLSIKKLVLKGFSEVIDQSRRNHIQI
ncbi:MAG: hypothetical protein EZS28_031685, partial [Streblomastix strix]